MNLSYYSHPKDKLKHPKDKLKYKFIHDTLKIWSFSKYIHRVLNTIYTIASSSSLTGSTATSSSAHTSQVIITKENKTRQTRHGEKGTLMYKKI